MNYDEARWSYSSLKWNTFTQFGSKTSSTLFLESALTILSAIVQDYYICKEKWQKCLYKPLKTHIGPKTYPFLPQAGPKNYTLYSQHLLKWFAKNLTQNTKLSDSYWIWMVNLVICILESTLKISLKFCMMMEYSLSKWKWQKWISCKTLVGPKIGHFYPCLDPKACLLCYLNLPLGLF